MQSHLLSRTPAMQRRLCMNKLSACPSLSLSFTRSAYAAQALPSQAFSPCTAAFLSTATGSSFPNVSIEARYKGTSFDGRTKKWKAVVTYNGKKIDLGRFDDAKSASDAYFAAKAVFAAEKKREKELEALKKSRKADKAEEGEEQSGDEGEGEALQQTEASATAGSADGAATAAKPSRSKRASSSKAASQKEGSSISSSGEGGSDSSSPSPSSKYIGVIQEGPGATQWEAVITVNGKEISGGEYPSEEEAAKAYDALSRMYLGPSAPTNFAMDPYAAWVPPEEVVTTGQIETKKGVPLTVEEVVQALRQERGIDVRVVSLKGKLDLADNLIFVTGKNMAHMGKMADMLSRALRKRELPGIDPTVEARDMDDWMVVDAGNLVINIMDAEAREVFDLENFYEGMKEGQDPWEGMSYEQWLEANPVPEKWLRRLEKDEADMEALQRVAPPPTASYTAAKKHKMF